jgi:hypothetical protein
MEIKGLYEALGISQNEVDDLRGMVVRDAAQRLMFYSKIVANGGTIHRVHPDRKAKNRAANRVARKSRRVNKLNGAY